MPRNGQEVGGARFFGAAQGFEDQSEVGFGFDVMGIERKAVFEGLLGVGEVIFVVLRAAEVIPGFNILRVSGDGCFEPVFGIGIVFKEHVVEGDDFKFGSAGVFEFRASRVFGKRVFGLGGFE